MTDGTSAAHPTRLSVDDAYEELFGSLVRLAYLVTLDDQEAADVVQDCFIGAMARWDEIDQPAAYLRRAVANRSYRSVRDRHRRRDKADRWQAGSPTHVSDQVDELADAIASLPDRERALVVLRYQLDLSTDDIAAALDMPRGSVGPTLGRALERLRKVVAQ